MKKRLTDSKVIRIAIFLIIQTSGVSNCTSSYANEELPTPDLYFLSIGISSFVDKQYKSKSFKAPTISAKLVASQLLRSGAKFGLLLTDDNNPAEPTSAKLRISRNDVFDAIATLKATIISDGTSATARVVIYIITHGFSDRNSNYRFMLPGNLMLPNDNDSSFSISKLAKHAISDIDIIRSMLEFQNLSSSLEHINLLENTNKDSTIKHSVPFILLFDNCADFFQEDQFHAVKYSKDIDSIYVSALQTGRIYYATAPGSSARTWILLPKEDNSVVNGSLSTNNDYAPWVGPLALQFAWILNEKSSSKVMSVDEFEEKLITSHNSKGGDHIPPRPFSLFNNLFPEPLPKFVPEFARGKEDLNFFPQQGTHRQEVTLSQPTGSETIQCCD